ncbi:hypothetical protein EGT74_18405 [Chitinophaga lutea]|uniref:Uncharacterized protein n=1 Tax=Chitinophaga lutea TaxID=2488634 RepID=A0A3N4PMF4_9BACT|nr:hypothetical protein [Chitinophaga lutea]RPE08985.1 hypothetical protein EGT74_18405 [Chitinophaga lutea]
MSNLATQLLSFTVLIPLIMGLVRMNRIRASYHPFLLFLFLAFTAEVVSEISIRLTRDNRVTNNIYIFLEAAIILYQFYTWGYLRRKKWLLGVLGTAYLITWTVENIGMGVLANGFSSYFVILYSLTTVFLSISEINLLITSYSGNLFRNAKFLICIGFIIIGVYSLITEGFLLIDPYNSSVSRRIFIIFAFINAFVNIVYAVAVYFLPVRDDYYFSKRFKA